MGRRRAGKLMKGKEKEEEEKVKRRGEKKETKT